MPLLARPDALGDCVERLAKKAAALPHERKMTLVWTSHAALSDQQVEHLRALFASQMEMAQVRFVQGEAAPALWVSIEQTPSQIVFTARVPGDNRIGVAIEQLPRAQAGSEDDAGSNVRLEKELVWHQESRVLSAAIVDSGEGAEKRLVLLSEEALTIYQGGPGDWRSTVTKPLPGPRQTQRSARGQLLVAGERAEQAGILLPGRRCETSLTDLSPVACAAVAAEWPTGRRMALPSCATETWWLSNAGGDFASEDRLLLRDAGAGKGAPAAELALAGPVVSLSAGPNPASASVLLRNLRTGNYEVYRVALACGD